MMNKEKEKFTKEKYEQWQQSCFYVLVLFSLIIIVSGCFFVAANIDTLYPILELLMRVAMGSIAISLVLYVAVKTVLVFYDFFSGLNTYGRYFWQELNTEEEKVKNDDGYFAPDVQAEHIIQQDAIRDALEKLRGKS